jgi:hypothetical protein
MTGYVTHAEPSVIRRAAEMWPEGVEVMPYATNWKPLYPFPGSSVTAGGSGIGGSSATALASQTASPCDLSFTRGDSVTFTFFFPGVCWTLTDPGGTPPVPWEKHVWNAQIRDPNHYPHDPCTLCNSWIPMWGTLPTNEQIRHYTEWTLLTEFMCEAEFLSNTAVATGYATYGTLVTISLDNTVDGSGTLIRPADTYKWDLQTGTDYVLDLDGVITSVLDPVTVLGGNVEVVADYTYAEEVTSA